MPPFSLRFPLLALGDLIRVLFRCGCCTSAQCRNFGMTPKVPFHSHAWPALLDDFLRRGRHTYYQCIYLPWRRLLHLAYRSYSIILLCEFYIQHVLRPPCLGCLHRSRPLHTSFTLRTQMPRNGYVSVWSLQSCIHYYAPCFLLVNHLLQRLAFGPGAVACSHLSLLAEQAYLHPNVAALSSFFDLDAACLLVNLPHSSKSLVGRGRWPTQVDRSSTLSSEASSDLIFERRLLYTRRGVLIFVHSIYTSFLRRSLCTHSHRLL